MKCVVCDRPLRPYWVRVADAPGTLAHKGRGLCSKHYNQAKAAGFAGYPELRYATTVGPSRPVGDPEPYTAAGLDSFIRRRRERIARQEQVIPRTRRRAA